MGADHDAERRTSAVTGWGGTAPTVAAVRTGDVDRALATAGRRGVIARGLGRAYGDAAQNAGGIVVELDAGGGAVELDEATGVVTAHAAASFDEVLRSIVPRGWFVPVTPGTRFITVGGAVAADVHGKNHHVDGAFGAHVAWLDLCLADGTRRRLRPDAEPGGDDHDLWVATVGGMGLTGVIERVAFRALPIETARCAVLTERVDHLDALLERIVATESARYSVAWIDLVATGRRLGRSVLTTADHASLERLRELDRRAAATPLAFDPGVLADVPAGLPNLLSRPAVRAFNELWFRKAPRHAVRAESITGFFHPLDLVGRWNRLYGSAGFVQYQFVVPDDATDTLRSVIERITVSGHASFLAVLKRFGAEGDGLLSFPRPGWTLALDLPAAAPGIAALLNALDDMVLAAGGRHYLAKDAVTRPEVIAAGYPELDRWREIRDRFDPDRRWQSDLSRRLGLIGSATARA
ncbi:MAG: FAD-binding oxidoreductase [Actinomycetota bacterium]